MRSLVSIQRPSYKPSGIQVPRSVAVAVSPAANTLAPAVKQSTRKADRRVIRGFMRFIIQNLLIDTEVLVREQKIRNRPLILSKGNIHE